MKWYVNIWWLTIWFSINTIHYKRCGGVVWWTRLLGSEALWPELFVYWQIVIQVTWPGVSSGANWQRLRHGPVGSDSVNHRPLYDDGTWDNAVLTYLDTNSSWAETSILENWHAHSQHGVKHA